MGRNVYVVSIFLALLLCLIRLAGAQTLTPASTVSIPGPAAILFSAGGLGYPTIRCVEQNGEQAMYSVQWLDRKTLRLTGPKMTDISDPHVSVSGAALVGYTPAGMRNATTAYLLRMTPAGQSTRILVPYQSLHITSASDGGLVGAEDLKTGSHLLKLDGSLLAGPAGAPCVPTRYESASELYQVLNAVDSGISIYNLTEKRLVSTFNNVPEPNGPGMLFRDGERFLLVPRQGQALLLAGATCLATLGDTQTIWRWGEDGSVWTFEGSNVQILQWRAGTPSFVEVPGAKRLDGWLGDLTFSSCQPQTLLRNTLHWPFGPAWAAAWHDGALFARVDLARNETLRLKLYRYGELSGSFDFPLKSPTPEVIEAQRVKLAESTIASPIEWRAGKDAFLPSLCSEHLAFTKDGKYLSWLIDDGTGTVKGFVFIMENSEQ